jgi:hypothetical protein
LNQFEDVDKLMLILFSTIILFFTVFIFLLLRLRKRIMENSLQITSDQLWSSISDRVEKFFLQKSDMLFGINQDWSNTVAYLLIKNAQDEIVGRVYFKVRKRIINISEKEFLVHFPLTWHRSANLYSSEGKVIATYRQYAFGRHEYDVPGFGLIQSIRIRQGIKNLYFYKIDSKVIGVREEITSNLLSRGRLVILPAELPLEVRLFILSVAP